MTSIICIMLYMNLKLTLIVLVFFPFLLAFAGRLLGENWGMVAEFIDQYEHIVIIAGIIVVVVFFINRLLKLRKQKAAA